VFGADIHAVLFRASPELEKDKFMESIYQTHMVRNSLTYLHIASHPQHVTKSSRIHRFLNTIALAGLMGIAALAAAISHAAPPAHANASERARNNSPEGVLPENARAKRGGNEEWARGRILVTPRAGLPAKVLVNILREHGGKPKKIGQSDLYVVELPEYTEESAIARLARHPHIKFAELDHYVEPTFVPNDPYYPNGWRLPKMGSPTAWSDSHGLGITIAILDSGVDGNHPDLAAKLIPGWNFYDNNPIRQFAESGFG
jgi:thermitase